MKIKLLNADGKPFDYTVATIEVWYDLIAESWVVQSKNAAGDQIGDCEYSYRRKTALRVAADIRTEGVPVKLFTIAGNLLNEDWKAS